MAHFIGCWNLLIMCSQLLNNVGLRATITSTVLLSAAFVVVLMPSSCKKDYNIKFSFRRPYNACLILFRFNSWDGRENGNFRGFEYLKYALQVTHSRNPARLQIMAIKSVVLQLVKRIRTNAIPLIALFVTIKLNTLFCIIDEQGSLRIKEILTQ